MNSDKLKLKRNLIEFSIILICALVVLVFYLLIKFEAIKLPQFVRIIFGLDFSEDNADTDSFRNVTDIKNADIDESEIYLDVDSETLLGMLTEVSQYRRDLRIIYSYGTERRVIKYTVYTDGEKYRAESDSKLLIFDGKTLYIDLENSSSIQTENIKTDVYSEVGFTSLAEVKKIAMEANCMLSFTPNKKNLKAEIRDENGILLDEYEISTEYGIVTSEYHYVNGVLCRTVVTDRISSVEYNNDINNMFFEIPTQ